MTINSPETKTPKERTYLIYGALAGVITGGLIGLWIGGELSTFVGAVIGVILWTVAMEAARITRRRELGR